MRGWMHGFGYALGMDLDGLNEAFGLDGVLAFEQWHGLACARVTLAGCEARVFLYGAHLASWIAGDGRDVLFLSGKSPFEEGKAIRGGVPVCFPWFGPRGDGLEGPAHGFARIQAWDVVFAAFVPGEYPVLRLTFGLGANPLSRSLGWDGFRVAYEMTFGAFELKLRFSVANTGLKAFKFEEALHSYFAVGDARAVAIGGLESATYLDKTDGFREKETPAGPLVLTEETDRVYAQHEGGATVEDGNRLIRVEKVGSATTVLWNPWKDLKDVQPEGWQGFVCVETANTGADAVTLQPGEAKTMECVISVGPTHSSR